MGSEPKVPELRGMWSAWLLIIFFAAQAFSQGYVQRGQLERQGNAWVEKVECSALVREGSKIILHADAGSVNVSTGPNDQIRCHVTLSAYMASQEEARNLLDGYQLTVRPLDGGALVESRLPVHGKRGREKMAAKIGFVVPTRIQLEIETQAGDISIADAIEGSVRAETAAGDVSIANVSGPVTVETAGGNISLGNAGGPVDLRTAGGSIRTGKINGDATLETSGGDIEAGQINGMAKAETAGGDIQLAGVLRSAKVETSGGQIRIGEAGGSVVAETAGGGILVGGAHGRVTAQTRGGSINLFDLAGAVRAETAAGRILAQLAATPRTFGPSRLETSSGDVEVFIPPDLPLTIRAIIRSADGHKIVSDFPLTLQSPQPAFDGRPVRAEAQVNGGGQILMIRSVDGGIEIHKLDAATLERLKEQEKRFWQR